MTHFCSLKLSVLFSYNSRNKRFVNYYKRMLFSLAYCWILASFVAWSSRTKSSLSKVSIVLLLSRFLFCILLFSFRLNKFSKKYILKIPQVMELRSWTLSSTIHIFTKSHSLSLLPEACTKWKKIVAENCNWIFCLVPNKIFSITFLSSWIIKFFKPSIPNKSKKKMSAFGSMSSMLH